MSAAFPTEFAVVTYVYGKPLCVRQVAEDFVGGQSNAFIHGVSAWGPVKPNAFRHSRCSVRKCLDTWPRSSNQDTGTERKQMTYTTYIMGCKMVGDSGVDIVSFVSAAEDIWCKWRVQLIIYLFEQLHRVTVFYCHYFKKNTLWHCQNGDDTSQEILVIQDTLINTKLRFFIIW